MRRRRLLFLALVGATVALLTYWLVAILSSSGLGLLALPLLIAFVIDVSWRAVHCCNALVGFALQQMPGDPLTRVMPLVVQERPHGPTRQRVAVVITTRNEDAEQVFSRLRAIKASLDANGNDERFGYFVLSDTNAPAVAADEERLAAAWRRDTPDQGRRIVYRRRAVNIGFKAGNIHDFCATWGSDYAFMLLLDCDSLMTGSAIRKLVAIMEDDPRLGILQGFAVPLPSSSFFARVYQFGHLLDLRGSTLGAAWWQGECGAFWGHDAVIRIAPYAKHCRLPVLSGRPPWGGHIVVHDQVDISLMQRARFAVRFLPQTIGCYEGNPPTLPDFLARSERWLRGSVQNLRLLAMPGLPAFSRLTLILAAGELASGTAVCLFTTAAALAVTLSPPAVPQPIASAIGLYGAWIGLLLTPKLLGAADALIHARPDYGGAARLILGIVVETLFTLLLVPIAACATTSCLITMPFRLSVRWDAQRREGYSLPLRAALRALWLPTAFGLALTAWLVVAKPGALLSFLPFIAGLIAAQPFAIITSSPLLAAWAGRLKLCATPEEIVMPTELAALVRAGTS
jgi:membrane glycosyltransferase